MADQRSLFEKYREPLAATDPHVATEDKPRLTGQNHTILAMLCERPRTNDELAAVSRKYTSRISDIRAAGYAVNAKRLGGGLFLYTLES